MQKDTLKVLGHFWIKTSVSIIFQPKSQFEDRPLRCTNFNLEIFQSLFIKFS